MNIALVEILKKLNLKIFNKYHWCYVIVLIVIDKFFQIETVLENWSYRKTSMYITKWLTLDVTKPPNCTFWI